MSILRVLAANVLERPVPDAPIAISVPDTDDEISANLDHLGHAEGQSFAIEYIDSRNRSSTRRVTVWGIVAGSGGAPSLIAYCHERQAQRQFRIDRIQSFIDYDGEVHDNVSLFVIENFGMRADLASRKSGDGDRRWQAILSAIKHDAVILSALSRSDGKTVAEEVEVATDYLGRMAERGGFMLDDSETLAIYRYANRLRPTEDAIARAIDAVSALGHRHIERLLLAAVNLVDADGRRHPQEIALINEIAVELIGTPVA